MQSLPLTIKSAGAEVDFAGFEKIILLPLLL